MKYFLFIILVSIIIFIYFYYERKLYNIKKQLRITSNQYRDIRNRYKTTVPVSQSLSVKFIIPSTETAITNIKADIYIAPLYDSQKLKTLNTKMEVKVIDSALVNNSTWYYVSLPIDSAYNCRGWINQRDFSIIPSTPHSITRLYKN